MKINHVKARHIYIYRAYIGHIYIYGFIWIYAFLTDFNAFLTVLYAFCMYLYAFCVYIYIYIYSL